MAEPLWSEARKPSSADKTDTRCFSDTGINNISIVLTAILAFYGGIFSSRQQRLRHQSFPEDKFVFEQRRQEQSIVQYLTMHCSVLR